MEGGNMGVYIDGSWISELVFWSCVDLVIDF